MKKFFLILPLFLFFSSSLSFAEEVNLKPRNPKEWREYIRFRRDETLKELYKINPHAKDDINRAKGYAVFVNFNLKVFFVGGGTGRGLIHENKLMGGKETFMRMAQGGVGLGLGVKDFRAVFVFDDEQVMKKFLSSGWQFGGDADAAVKGGDAGLATSGAIGIAPGLRVYQLTENGLALQAMLNGTKFWVDREVNE